MVRGGQCYFYFALASTLGWPVLLGGMQAGLVKYPLQRIKKFFSSSCRKGSDANGFLMFF